MKTVFLVEQGDYSDYKVVGIFSDMENASQVASLIGDGATVSERPLNPGINELNSGMQLFRVCMDYDGTVEVCLSESINSYSFTQGGLCVWPRTVAPFYRNKSVSDAVQGYVWAKDGNHATKITNEFRVHAIADGKLRHWINASGGAK